MLQGSMCLRDKIIDAPFGVSFVLVIAILLVRPLWTDQQKDNIHPQLASEDLEFRRIVNVTREGPFGSLRKWTLAPTAGCRSDKRDAGMRSAR